MGRIRFPYGLLLYCALSGVSIAAPPQDAAKTAASVREYVRANQHGIARELVEFLSIPNFATDQPNIQRNAQVLVAMLEKRGAKTRLLEIPERGPVVYGEIQVPGAKRTVLYYCHYDGQPTDANRWNGSKPFEPVLRTNMTEKGGTIIRFPGAGTVYQDDWRIYARSASDDKSPIVALVAALDALKAKNIPLAHNVKFILDGEEEAGSPNLEKTLLAHRDLIAGDLLITGDGPVHQSGRPLIFFGNRGVMDWQITVYGPTRALHSGHYGNWAPNPAMRLAQLLASMKDENGRVLVAGFYDDVTPLSEREKRALAEMPANDADLMRELGLAGVDGGGKKLVELLNEPSLNIRGINSAFVGAGSQNIVPTQATASLDCRLVKNIDPKKQFDRVVAHIRKQGYFVVDRDPTAEERAKYPKIARVNYGGGYPAARTTMDSPMAQALVRVMDSAMGTPVVKMPTIGGSAPMHIFENIGLPVIGVPIVNHDNNQHSENENLRMGNLWRGIEIYGALLGDLKW
ncbi:MAG: M20/M25/M40 family metallo-hydrolase [Acidobacteria bacterium]|nr:M20/M25/M40 family metallo-hydrolase [Acidobacteriota bacterium]